MNRLVLFSISLIVYVSAQGQFSGGFGDQSMKGVDWKERIYTGGGMGLGFGTTQDYISVSPIIGYRVSTRFTPGIGIIYRYTNYKLVNPNIKLNDYGLSIYARYYIIPELFLHSEYEHLNYEFATGITTTVRKSFNSFLSGAGYVFPIGNRSSFFVMALYNFSYRQQTNPIDQGPYQSPLILRAGLNIGFLNF